MKKMIHVKVVGTPVACKDGLQETWREVAGWAANRLKTQYGDRIRVHYYDLFDPDCPLLPVDSKLPIVFVNEVVISSGGKISIPLIRKKIEDLG